MEPRDTLDHWCVVAAELGAVSEVDGSWALPPPAAVEESMQDRIIRITADEKDLLAFYNISLSKTRQAALYKYYSDELVGLESVTFEQLNQEDKVDYLLLKNNLNRNIRRLELEARRYADVSPFLPFAENIIALCESRQQVLTADLEPRDVAERLHDSTKQVQDVQALVERGELCQARMAAFRVVRSIKELGDHLDEFYKFFKGYDPLFDWWVTSPFEVFQAAMSSLASVIQTKLVSGNGDDDDDIIGDAIGEEGLLAELEAEFIPYTPSKLLTIARRHYAWCESEMKKASSELGFGTDWRAALEHVKTLHVSPGDQARFVKDLVDEGASYVKHHDLVTVPPLAEQTWRMTMMTPARQLVSPFFLGGPKILVAYPTASMSHTAKLSSMRGNNRHFARATAFHEMVPGHRLQLFAAERHARHRLVFGTPFYIEGWALYWEMVLWERGDFFVSAEDRVGTLFWRMHRCARVCFSLGFHLGKMEPRECVDLLVDMVGHERATAEGEVRRSLNGDYGPLYQAAYLLGALQLYALRKEVLGAGVCGEKEFNDRVLRANEMPIELLRALLLNKDLERDYKARWKFGGEVKVL